MSQPYSSLLTDAELASCAVIVEQKGDDIAECRNRVMAGLSLWQELVPHSPACRLAVVGGAGGDVPASMIRDWCAGSGAEPAVLNESRHTRDKALSIQRFTRREGITTVVQVTSLYHSLRAYLTTAKVLEEAGSEITVINHVSDTDDPCAVVWALLDGMYLASAIEPQLGFGLGDEHYRLFIQASRGLAPSPGHRAYLTRRHGEARRIADYAEPGKNHLTTSLPVKQILASYPLAVIS
jgi:hypothetical protein